MSALVTESTMTQCDMILAYMREHGSISQLEAAFELGCWRLAARISDIRAEGYSIKRDMISAKNKYGKTIAYARYTLAGEEDS